MKNEKKFDFYFPSNILKEEDFSPVETSVLKDYYRNSFLELIDKVRNHNILILKMQLIVGERDIKKNIYRSLLLRCAKSPCNCIRF